MSSPASAPLAGGNEDIGYRLVAVAVATISIASIIVAIRLYVRVKIVRVVGWDDWLMLFSLVLGIVAAATEIEAVSLGLGRHAYYLTVDQTTGAGEYEAISSAFSIMSLCFGKISICISLLRIIRGAGWRKLKLALYVTIIVVSIVNALVTIMTLVQCHPITKIWNPSIPGSCLNIDVQKDLAYLQGAVSAFTDFELSLLPILVFQSLQMDKRSKVVLSSLMGIGFLTGVTAIMRIVYIEPYARLDDMTYTSINLQIWAA
ncbi:hypothetical protein MMC17_004840 [Xylographa soralifera]|nr:hypothetical protein [Xylographa soralifera]